MTVQKKPLVVAVVGATATGKTEAAVDLCAALGGEVLSMDSMQIYRRLSIGTAKPTPKEMRGIPHHLLSFISPENAYTVQEYQQDARAVMAKVLESGKLPVFCGGTGLYLQAVSRPLRFAEAGENAELRTRMAAMADMPGGPETLHAQLSRIDPETAARLHVHDVRRVIRAIEVYRVTGTPISARRREWEAEGDETWVIFALRWPREVLYDRINRRVDRMLQNGLLEEIASLLRSGVSPETQAMRAIGYQEFVPYLRGQCSLQEAVERVKTHSRQYAKRQLTWFRRDARVRWVEIERESDDEAARQSMVACVRALREERT